MATILDFVNATSAGVTAFGTVGLFALGAVGLTSWRNQLHWEENHDLAKRMLHAIYKVRDMVHLSRNPAILPGEAGEQAGADWGTNAYARRWARVSDARLELDTLLTEADVLWIDSRAIRAPERELRGHLSKLYIAIQHNATRDAKLGLDLFTDEDNRVLYSMSGPVEAKTPDDYDKQLNDIIAKFEHYLRRYLGPRR